MFKRPPLDGELVPHQAAVDPVFLRASERSEKSTCGFSTQQTAERFTSSKSNEHDVCM